MRLSRVLRSDKKDNSKCREGEGNGMLEIPSSWPSWEMISFFVRNRGHFICCKNRRKKRLFCTAFGAFRYKRKPLDNPAAHSPSPMPWIPKPCSLVGKKTPFTNIYPNPPTSLGRLLLQGDEQELWVNIQPHFCLFFPPEKAFKPCDKREHGLKAEIGCEISACPWDLLEEKAFVFAME